MAAALADPGIWPLEEEIKRKSKDYRVKKKKKQDSNGIHQRLKIWGFVQAAPLNFQIDYINCEKLLDYLIYLFSLK